LSLLRWLNRHSLRNTARESGEKAYLWNQNLPFKEVGRDTIDGSDIYVFHLRLRKKKENTEEIIKTMYDKTERETEKEAERVNNIM
jgi:hypothetical protein